MRRPRLASLLAVVYLVVATAACGDDSGGSAGEGTALEVVTTTTVLTDFAHVIGGDRVAVYGVLRPNVDPHDYEPSARDLNSLRDADVIVMNGVHLEAWLDDAVGASDAKAPIVDASTGVTIRSAGATTDSSEGDPHIWNDPRNAKQMVTTISPRSSAPIRPVLRSTRRTRPATRRSSTRSKPRSRRRSRHCPTASS